MLRYLPLKSLTLPHVFVHEDLVQNLNKTKFADPDFFSNLRSLYFSVGHVLMLATILETEVQSFHDVQSWRLLRYR